MNEKQRMSVRLNPDRLSMMAPHIFPQRARHFSAGDKAT
jgi:hypothetical protein